MRVRVVFEEQLVQRQAQQAELEQQVSLAVAQLGQQPCLVLDTGADSLAVAE